MARTPSKGMRGRMFFVLMFITVVGLAALLTQLVRLQLIDGEYYQQKAFNQQLRDTDIAPSRGTIYDTNMKTLAASATVWTVVISPKNIKEEDREEIAKGLSEILEVDEAEILEKSKKSNYYEVIKRKVELEVANKVRDFCTENDLYGVSLIEDSKRYYPYDNFCANVLGFVGTDNQGLAGIEAYYNSYLTGSAGRILSAKNAWGTDMPYQYEESYDAQDGNSLVLTIDETLQHYLEKYLEQAVVENDAKSAAGIAMDPNTGEILAMASKGDYDPNNPFEIFDQETREAIAALPEEQRADVTAAAQQEQWRNEIVSDLYEPGSVFKIVTASAALEENVADLDTTFTCTGSAVVAGTTIRCWKDGGHGSEDFTRGMCNSCNPFFIMLGQRLGTDLFTQYFNGFGLNEKTNIDLPGEAQSLYYTADNMGPVELASCSFGQSNKITPLQMVTAVSAAVNGGNLMQPYLIKRILDSDGNVVASNEPTVRRNIISAETSSAICAILEQNVKDGGAKNAYISGYRIGGKTGTSQKLDSDDETARIASYVGVAPCDDPQIVVLVYIDEPRAGSTYGSIVAAPVVRDFLNDALPYLGVETKYSEAEIATVDVVVPSLTGREVNNAKSILGNNGLLYRVVGEGSTVLKQIPAYGQEIPKGSTVMLYTEEVEIRQVTVPNLENMTVSQATTELKNLSLNIKVVGGGEDKDNVYAVSQSVGPGEKVEVGTTITVEFISKDAMDL